MTRSSSPDRPAFITGRDTGRVPEVRVGLAWLTQWPTGEPVIVSPTKGQYSSSDLAEALGDAAADALARGRPAHAPDGRPIRGETQQTFKHMLNWRGGPVLVLWPDAKALIEIDRDPRTQAICVVPWTYDEVETWARGRRATDLTSPSNEPRPSIGDPVVAVAMASLTMRVNLSTGLLHSSDKAAAVEAFRILARARKQWDPAEIEAWALDNGWSGRGAAELREVAAGVLAGHRYQVRSGGSWRPDIIDVWESDAK